MPSQYSSANEAITNTPRNGPSPIFDTIAPFVAIAQGRNRLVWREIGWLRPWLAIVLWGVLIALHPLAFDVNPARYFHG